MLCRLLNFPSLILLPLSKTKTIHFNKFRFLSSTTLALSSSETPFTKPLKISSFDPSTFKILKKLYLYRNNPSLALSYFTQLKNHHVFSHNIQTYASIIRILCYYNLDRKLDSLFRDIIISHSKQNPSFEIHDLFEKLLEGVDIVKNKKHYLAILRAFDVFAKACVGLNMFDEAFDFLFHFQVTRFEILPSIFACNFLINRLVQHDKVKMALEVYKEIKRVGLCPNHHTYAIVIKSLCKNSDDLKHVLCVFDDMEEAGVTPNSYCYAAYIEGLCNNNMSDDGYKVLKRCRESNAPIEVYAYAAVIRGFCNEMKLDKAEDVFYDMKSWGHVPDFHVYSPLISGYCKINDGLRARSLHDDMISKGIETNCVIVSYILHCLGEMGKDSEVVDVFKEVKQSCVFLDGVAYNIVLDSLCKLGKVDDAVSTLEELKSMNIDLDIKHYTTLINGYCLQGKTVEAQCLFKEMEEKGFKPDVVAYNVLAAGLFRKDLDSEAIDLLIYMDSQGVKPNSTTHKIIIEGYCSVGKVGEAEAYFNRMKNESVELYTAMINGYCEADLIEKSYDLFFKLSNQGYISTESSGFEKLSKLMCSKVLAALCQARNMERARSLFDFFIGRGFTLGVVTYTIMIKGYCRMNCLQEAHDLFQDMKRRGIEPNVVTYTVLLHGKLKQAYLKMRSSSEDIKGSDATYNDSTILREMEEMKVSPNVVTYTVLIDGHIKIYNFEKAMRFFNEIIDQGLKPDRVTYTALIWGLLNGRQKELAIIYYYEMSTKGMAKPLHIPSGDKKLSKFFLDRNKLVKLNRRILQVIKVHFCPSEKNRKKEKERRDFKSSKSVLTVSASSYPKSVLTVGVRNCPNKFEILSV